MLSDNELRRRMIGLVRAVKSSHPDRWDNPHQLAEALGVRTASAALGGDREGLHVENVIIVDEQLGTAERIRFTWYHEISHHVLRADDDLFSELHDRHEGEAEFERVREWLCNVGAAEFLLESSTTYEFLRQNGYSLAHLPTMCATWGASSIASAIQLVSLAPHRCLCLIFRTNGMTLEYVIRSQMMQHSVAKRTLVPVGHMIRHAAASIEGELLEGIATIPFNNGRRWDCDCQAMSYRGWTFALFHPDPRPAVLGTGQLRFDI